MRVTSCAIRREWPKPVFLEKKADSWIGVEHIRDDLFSVKVNGKWVRHRLINNDLVEAEK